MTIARMFLPSQLHWLFTGALALLLSACGQTPQSTELPKQQPQQQAATMEQAPWAVGSRSFFIHDSSRAFDSVGGVATGVRSLLTEIWYPVAKDSLDADSKRARFGDYVFGNRDVHRRMMTQTSFYHLTPDSVREGIDQESIDTAIEELFTRERGSYLDAAPASADKPWPVIVMSHGDAGSRYNMQSVCEHLAKHGYIVIAPDHTGNSPYAMSGADPALQNDSAFKQAMAEVLPLLDDQGVYGKAATLGQSYVPLADGFNPQGLIQLDRAVVERVNDLRAVLDTLQALNTAGDFAGLIDLQRVGLMGRSFGGLTTLGGLQLEPRFKTGFAVVPPMIPNLRAALPPALLPEGESILFAAQDAATQFSKPTFLLMGGEDALILGLTAQLHQAMGLPAPAAAAPYPLASMAVAKAQVPAVYALADNTNHGSFGVAGPYWWPTLKPDTFARFFQPDTQYQLLNAEAAHAMQQAMALAWFNYSLLGQAPALDTLRQNPWAQQAVRLQFSPATALQALADEEKAR